MRIECVGLCFGMFVAFLAAAPAVAQAQSKSAPPQVADHVVLEDMYPEARVMFPNGVVGLPNVTYADFVGYQPLRLDIYLPPNDTPGSTHPLVMYIHGGGWFAGHARQSGAFSNWPAALASIAARGYVVTSVNYRLSGEAPFPAAEQDIKTALRWLRAHADEYGIDKSKALVWGASAGGHLAALTAVSCGVKTLEPSLAEMQTKQTDVSHPASQQSIPEEAQESDCVQGAITWYGVFDFTSITAQRAKPAGAGRPPADDAVGRFLGCGDRPCTENALKAASPVTYISAKTPPMQIVCGSKDTTVPPAQSKEFYKRLKEAGVPATLTVIPGANHSFIGPDGAGTKADSIKAFDMAVNFIDQTFSAHRTK